MYRAAVMLFLLAPALLWAQTNPLSPQRTALDWQEARANPDKKILAMSETDASLLLRQMLSELCEENGVKLNSISSRKSKPLENGLMELRVYAGYDAEFTGLAHFLNALAEHELGIVVETLNISSRRQPRHSTDRPARAALNGNMVVFCLLIPDENVGMIPTDPETDRSGYYDLVPRVLTELVHHLPGEAVLTNIQVKRGIRLQLMGETDHQEVVARYLAEAPLFSSEQVVTLEETRFRYAGNLNPDIHRRP